jgi:hypothetical protein
VSISRACLLARKLHRLANLIALLVEILVERRRLGQTDLAVKPGVVGINNATKAENLGIFDYAHLRVPLPHDLQNSGIFTPLKSGAYPESYFLMVGSQSHLRRRS